MTRQTRARRMRCLIASLMAMLGLVAGLNWYAARRDAVPALKQGGWKPASWVTLNGVEYRPTEEVSPPDRGFPTTRRAGVAACDPVSGRPLWQVTIREGTWPESGRGMPSSQGPTHAQFLAGFALTLAVKGSGLSVTTPDGGDYLVDPETRQVRQLRAPSPPKPPVLEARVRGKTRCEVHDRPMLEDVVPIRYGLGVGILPGASAEVRRTQFPNANAWFGGGCLVGESREARVLYCPECRESERVWSEKRPAEPADHKDSGIRAD